MTGKMKEKIVSGDGDEDNVGFGNFEAIERPNIDETLNKLKKDQEREKAKKLEDQKQKEKQKKKRERICVCGVRGCYIGPMKYVSS